MKISKSHQEKNKAFNLSISSNLREWINQKSKEYGMSSASYVRMILLEEKKRQDSEVERM